MTAVGPSGVVTFLFTDIEGSDPYQGGNLLTDMAARGKMLQPVDVDTNGKCATLTDGHHRLAAARRLGMSHVPVHVYWRTEPGWGDHPSDRLAPAGPGLRDWVAGNSPDDLEAMRG
jgi:ParB-like nuclease domain